MKEERLGLSGRLGEHSPLSSPSPSDLQLHVSSQFLEGSKLMPQSCCCSLILLLKKPEDIFPGHPAKGAPTQPP